MKINPQNKPAFLLSTGHLAGVLAAVLEQGACFRFKAAGHSMSPFIRNGDVITIRPVPDKGVRPGQVVAIKNVLSGTVVVHRVVAIKKGLLAIKGDNLSQPDGLFQREALLGLVSQVERDDRFGYLFGWLDGWLGSRVIAWLSNSGLLNSLILPGLRTLKK